MQPQPQPDVSDRWIQHQRRNNKTTPCWSCIFCPDRKIYLSDNELKEHARADHRNWFPANEKALEDFLESFAVESAQKKPTKDSSNVRKLNLNEANKTRPEPPPYQSKRPLNGPWHLTPTRSTSGLGALDISTARRNEGVTVQDLFENSQATENQPRTRTALGDGITAGSGPLFHDSLDSPPPYRSKARPRLAQYGPTSNPDTLLRDIHDTQGGSYAGKRQLWSPDQQAPLIKAPFNNPLNTDAMLQIQSVSHLGATLVANTTKYLSTLPHPINILEQLIAVVAVTSNLLTSLNSALSRFPSFLASLSSECSCVGPLCGDTRKRFKDLEERVAEAKGPKVFEPNDFGLVRLPRNAWRLVIGNEQKASILRSRLYVGKYQVRGLQEAVFHMGLRHKSGRSEQEMQDLAVLRNRFPLIAEKMVGLVQSQKSRVQQLQPKTRKPFQPLLEIQRSKSQTAQNNLAPPPQIIVQHPFKLENNDILQPETRPISQAQLAVDVKAIAAGLVMVEVKSNIKGQATLAQPDLDIQPNFNDERWEALWPTSGHSSPPCRSTKTSYLRYNLPGRPISPVVGFFIVLAPPVARCTAPGLYIPFGPPSGLAIASIRISSTDLLTDDDPEEHLREYIDARKQPWSSHNRQSQTQTSDDRPNAAIGNQFLVPHSSKLGHIFHHLQRYSSFLGVSVMWGQIRPVAARSTETTEANSIHLPELTALAITLGVGFMIIRVAKRCWNIDLLFSANIVIPAACLYVALDHRFSNDELFVVWLSGLILNFIWLKDKVLKFSRSAGLIGLLLPLLGFLSASQFVRHFPELESRFDNQVVSTVVLSLPTTAFWSFTWVAAFERTGFAGELESGAYNTHIFGFIKYIFDAFIVRMIERVIESVTVYLFGERIQNYENNAFRRPPQDVEALPREFFPIPRHEPFRGPDNGNFYREESEREFSEQWRRSPGI